MSAKQLMLDIHKKMIVDLFAGGGGMSLAFERAFGRSPDVAINHDDDALSMHRKNHPQTRHFVADIFEVCPKSVTQGRAVGWLHGSPDCTHHSQAAGGQPRSKKIRGLGWVLPRWAGQVAPDVISMENVKQMLKWGPLVAKRDPATGRVVTLQKVACPKTGKMINRVANKGERVPVQDQYLVPDKKREGQTWRRFVATFESIGYVVDWRVRCAADAGGHTTRTRLFLIARRDGHPIIFPEPKFFKAPKKGQKRWKPASDCIDFTLPCRSIFERERPLAEATMKRIATGIRKFVLENPRPFIVNMAHGGKVEDIRQPVSTIATENGGCRALVAPVIAKFRGDSPGNAIDEPMPTITSGGGAARPAGAAHALGLIAPTLVQTGYGEREGQAPRVMDIDQPLVTAILSPTEEAGALRVAAFLMRYYGQGGQWSDLGDPLTTITTKDRMALVTVTIAGAPYVIVDIGLRMLEPRELYRAQDFPDSYIIEHGHDGRKFSKSAQVRMVGNSVDPVDAADFLEANAPWLAVRKAA